MRKLITINPFFFGERQHLFGILDSPDSGLIVERGVLVCYPIGQEYMHSHRSFRLLSSQFARTGIQCMRFDYSCTGDSIGETHECDLNQWTADVDAAVDYLEGKQLKGKVSIVGYRVGAAIATLAACQRGGIDSLVLWEPVLDGKQYLAEESAYQSAWLTRQGEVFGRGVVEDVGGELLGFPFPADLRMSLKSLNLLTLTTRPAPRILILTREFRREVQEFRAKLTELDAIVDLMLAPESSISKDLPMSLPIVPLQTLSLIGEWVRGALK